MNTSGINTTTGRAVSVSTATFFLFQVYQLDFFLHLSSRIPGIGVLRPSMILFVIIAFMLNSQKQIFKHRLDHRVFQALKAFLIMLLVTIPFVSYPGSVLKGNLPIYFKAIVFLYFTALILDTHKRFKWSLIVFVGCQVFRVLEPLYLHIKDGYWGDFTYLGDGEFADRLAGAPSDVINPNELGFVIVTAIPFLHYFLISGGWKSKALYAGLLAPLLYALILTMSRGAFLALLVVGWMVFKESKYKMVMIACSVVIALAGYSVMNGDQRERYFSLVHSEEGSAATKTKEGRILGMINEFKLGFTRPVFGHGLGTTAESKFHTMGQSQASHNMYAEIIIEVGLVGMFFFFKLIKAIFDQLSYSYKKLSEFDPFYINTFKSLRVIFWMFAVYSINYWGLSQYYWYNLAGLVVAAAFLSHSIQMTERRYR